MISIADYISHLLNELSEARRLSDHESLRMAQAYAEDDMLRHFPAPRFKLSEVELSIPLAISGTEMEDNLSFALSEQNFLYMVKKEMDQQVERAYGDVQMAATLSVASTYTLMSEWYKDLTQCKTWKDFDRSFDQYFAKITGEIQASTPSSVNVESSLREMPTRSISPINIYEILKRRFKVTNSLKKVMVDPQSSTVSSFGSNYPLVIVKAKLNEEGFVISSTTDESGKKKYSVNFE